MVRKSYSELLKDPRWQRRRLEILQRANFRCESCDSGERTLHVHHRVYRKGAMPWSYTDSELVCLCEDCHKEGYELQQRIARATAGAVFEPRFAEIAEALSAIETELYSERTDVAAMHKALLNAKKTLLPVVVQIEGMLKSCEAVEVQRARS